MTILPSQLRRAAAFADIRAVASRDRTQEFHETLTENCVVCVEKNGK
jgi:hypothetical protein